MTLKMSVFWVAVPHRYSKGASIIIALMMEAASTFETSVNFHQTTYSNNPDGSHLYTYHHKNPETTL
jgi:hypothetical protein